MVKKRVLFLNPPGDKPYLRDYFCSTISKGHYYWPPIDLLVQAGIIKNHHHVCIIDAIAENIGTDKCRKLIKDFSPHAILFVTGNQSFRSDFLFLDQIKKEKPYLKIIGTGDIFLDPKEAAFKQNKWLDGALLNFIGEDLLYFLDDKFDSIENMFFRKESKLHKRQNFKRNDPFIIPVPPHELFPLKKYHIPYSKYFPSASLLTSYGCPYKCSFCNSGSFGFRIRENENILDELNYIKSLGIREVFFKDMTFGVNKKYTIDLLKSICDHGMNFSWNCYSRIDILDEELVKWMKRAGCHIIQIGIESLNIKIMEKYGKAYKKKEILSCLNLLARYKIDFGLHFILGLPGETKEGILKIIDFAKQSDCKYASFNIATPRFGAKLKEHIISFNNRDLEEMRRISYRKFYLHYPYIFKQCSKIRSFYELKNLFYNGVKIYRGLL